MKDQDKTKEELINELVGMRQRIADLEESLVTLKQQQARPDLGRITDITDRTTELNTMNGGPLLKIAERKNAENDLRVTLTFVQTLLNAIPNPVYYKDDKGRYLGCNKVFTEWVGHSEQEIIGKTAYEVVSNEFAGMYHEQDLETLAHPGVRVFESSSLHPDGSVRSTIVSKSTFLNPDGSVGGLIASISDITDQRRAQEALRESEERYRVLIENLNEGIFVVKDGFIKFVNPRATEFMGYSADELTSSPFLEFVHPDDREMVMQRHRNRMAGDNAAYQYTMRIARHGGSVKWLLVSSRMIPWHRERATLVSTTDITSRKAAEDALRESEEKIRTLINAVPDIICFKDGEGRWQEANEFDLKLFNIEGVQYQGMKDSELAEFSDFYRDAFLTCEETDEKAWAAGGVSRGDEVIPLPDGSSKIFDVIKVPLFHPDGSRKGLVVVGRDMTELKTLNEELLREIAERKRVGGALRQSEEKYRLVVEKAQEAIFVAQDGVLRFVNPKTVEIVSYTEEELIGKSFTDFLHPDDREMVLDRHMRRLRGEEFQTRYAFRVVDKSGAVKSVEIDSALVSWEERPAALIFMSDITERKKVEDALRESEERYRELVEMSNDIVFRIDAKGFFTFVNRVACRITGYSEEELVGLHFTDLILPEYRKETEKFYGRQFVKKIPNTYYEFPFKTKNGEIIWVGQNVQPITRDDQIVGFQSITRDITERKEAEEALRKSEEFNRRLVDHAPFGILYLAVDGIIGYVNPAGNRIAGIQEGQVSPVLGRNILELPGFQDHSRVQENLRRLLEGEPVSDLEVPYTSSMGRDTVLLVAATPRFGTDGTVAGAILMFTDISERKRAEELQRETARYRAVVDLAGGVAHNFNNLLHIVMGHLELALIDMEAGDYAVVKDGLEKVLKSSRFGAEVVRRLQKFTQRRDSVEAVERGIFDLSEVARQAVEVSEAWLTIAEKEGRKVSLHTRLKEGSLVNADKNEMFGVIVDLVRNAVEALPTGGDVDLTTAVEGDKVVLQVRDTGIGISQENLGRVFNPFFTTKAEPGAGLSLASGRKIVEDCGGDILVDSVEGQGTSFTVLFPLAEKLPELTKALTEGDTEQRLTILVIDDVEVITDLMKSALTAYGHAVLTALSGEEGIEIFKENPPDVVICDLGMPGMSGWEVGKRISAICRDRGVPKTPFILLTAWAGQELETEQIARSGVDAVVGKPLKVQNIREVIQEVVEKSLSKDSER